MTNRAQAAETPPRNVTGLMDGDARPTGGQGPAGPDRPHNDPPAAGGRRAPRPDHRKESHDNYDAVVATIGRWRVIVCRDAIQWIIQYNGAADGSGRLDAWVGRNFCTTRAALLRDWRNRTGTEPPADLLALPDRVPPALRRAR